MRIVCIACSRPDVVSSVEVRSFLGLTREELCRLHDTLGHDRCGFVETARAFDREGADLLRLIDHHTDQLRSSLPRWKSSARAMWSFSCFKRSIVSASAARWRSWRTTTCSERAATASDWPHPSVALGAQSLLRIPTARFETVADAVLERRDQPCDRVVLAMQIFAGGAGRSARFLQTRRSVCRMPPDTAVSKACVNCASLSRSAPNFAGRTIDALLCGDGRCAQSSACVHSSLPHRGPPCARLLFQPRR